MVVHDMIGIHLRETNMDLSATNIFVLPDNLIYFSKFILREMYKYIVHKIFQWIFTNFIIAAAAIQCEIYT